MRTAGWIALAVVVAAADARGASRLAPQGGPVCRPPPASFPGAAPERGRADWLGVLEAMRRSRLSRAEQQHLAAVIVREADRNGLDPRLIAAVIHAESTFRVRARSEVGARGLMQVMPATGRWLMERRGERLGTASRLYEPDLNVALGTAYLAELIARFGSVEHALAAYNAGPTAARRILRTPARRERFLAGYPRKVMEEFERLKRSPRTGPTPRLASLDGTI